MNLTGAKYQVEVPGRSMSPQHQRSDQSQVEEINEVLTTLKL